MESSALVQYLVGVHISWCLQRRILSTAILTERFYCNIDRGQYWQRDSTCVDNLGYLLHFTTTICTSALFSVHTQEELSKEMLDQKADSALIELLACEGEDEAVLQMALKALNTLLNSGWC